MQGNLAQISLTDLLLLATSAKKSGVLKLTRGRETVEIHLSEGNIVHASCPIGDGDKALLYPVTWGEGSFNLLPDGVAPDTNITKTSAEILDEVKAMTREWETILQVIPSGKSVFRIADLTEENTDPITIPNVAWRVLSKLDGYRSVQNVAELLRIPFAYIAKVVFNLHKSGFVESVSAAAKPGVEIVPAALLTHVTVVLTDIIGPMAPFVLRDQIEALGESPERMPEAKLDELIGLIAREISDSKLKHKFEESVLQEVSNIKRF